MADAIGEISGMREQPSDIQVGWAPGMSKNGNTCIHRGSLVSAIRARPRSDNDQCDAGSSRRITASGR